MKTYEQLEKAILSAKLSDKPSASLTLSDVCKQWARVKVPVESGIELLDRFFPIPAVKRVVAALKQLTGTLNIFCGL